MHTHGNSLRELPHDSLPGVHWVASTLPPLLRWPDFTMGTRTATETVVGIFLAFFEQRTWRQAELSERLGVGTRALRQRLEELHETKRMPLEREEEPPHVYWSVPTGWVPGGVVLTGEEACQVLRLLARLPQSSERDRFLRRLVGHVGEEPSTNMTPLRVNEQILHIIEEAATHHVPIRFDYFTASRGDHRVRVASVHRLRGGDHWRFVATCHDRNQLCWFRVDSVLSASNATDHAFREVAESELNHFVSTSIDGFAGDATPVPCWFVARLPEARWVRNNLPEMEPFKVTESGAGLRFECETTALEVIARFVVGLGAVVTDCSSALGARVTAIARQSLDSLGLIVDERGSR